MINLLPSNLKQSYKYARRNTHLIHWIMALGVGIVGLAGIAGGSIMYLRQSTNEYTKQVSVSEDNLRKQNQAEVEKQVQNITNDLKLSVQVLSQEILFSKLLQQLATVVPSNTVLTDLNISKVNGGLDITAEAANYNTATQLQVNLSDPSNKIFSKADIVSINCTSSSSSTTTPTSSRYPCSVTIRALFTENNPYLFINSKSGS